MAVADLAVPVEPTRRADWQRIYHQFSFGVSASEAFLRIRAANNETLHGAIRVE
jgi:hypothetical protein